MYLLCWRRHGGLQYIGMSQDVDRRINAHRKAGRLPFAQLGGCLRRSLLIGQLNFRDREGNDGSRRPGTLEQ